MAAAVVPTQTQSGAAALNADRTDRDAITPQDATRNHVAGERALVDHRSRTDCRDAASSQNRRVWNNTLTIAALLGATTTAATLPGCGERTDFNDLQGPPANRDFNSLTPSVSSRVLAENKHDRANDSKSLAQVVEEARKVESSIAQRLETDPAAEPIRLREFNPKKLSPDFEQGDFPVLSTGGWLSAREDQILVIEISTVYCPPCKGAVKSLAEVQKGYAGDDRVRFLALYLTLDNANEDRKVVDLVRELGIGNLEIGLVDRWSVDANKVTGFPTTLIVRNGKLLFKKVGHEASSYSGIIESALKNYLPNN